MAAVVRIKRRLDEDPLETLVLNCKRRKTSGADEAQQQELSAVLRLAGTSQKVLDSKVVEPYVTIVCYRRRISRLCCVSIGWPTEAS